MNRIWEIDFLRGIALVLMIYYHLCFDLVEFYDYSLNYEGGLIYLLGKLSSTLFIILAGISSSLSKNNYKRSIKILGFALIITIATYIFDPETYIRFGILHLLGLSIFLSTFFIKLSKYTLLILGLLITLIGYYFKNITMSSNLLFPLGLINDNYISLDYFPLFPYFGVFLLGMFLGKILYQQKRSIINLNLNIEAISYLGRHSLLIYLVHQPLLLAFLYLFYSIFE
ncbi:heparan-alpha-glucosaminide N-acetyltransferase [Desulfonispora thiosulfatigenes]|nr:heparan-alpha-glucosaminide N-acetyltransferase [Desulfonispora thiosulfatigenes]